MDWYFKSFFFFLVGTSARFAIYSNSPRNGWKLVGERYSIDFFLSHQMCHASRFSSNEQGEIHGRFIYVGDFTEISYWLFPPKNIMILVVTVTGGVP